MKKATGDLLAKEFNELRKTYKEMGYDYNDTEIWMKIRDVRSRSIDNAHDYLRHSNVCDPLYNVVLCGLIALEDEVSIIDNIMRATLVKEVK